MIGKADFLPNLYVGSGAGIRTAFRKRRRPSAAIFNVTYTEQVFNLLYAGGEWSNKSRLKRKKFCWKTREIP